MSEGKTPSVGLELRRRWVHREAALDQLMRRWREENAIMRDAIENSKNPDIDTLTLIHATMKRAIAELEQVLIQDRY